MTTMTEDSMTLEAVMKSTEPLCGQCVNWVKLAGGTIVGDCMAPLPPFVGREGCGCTSLDADEKYAAECVLFMRRV